MVPIALRAERCFYFEQGKHVGSEKSPYRAPGFAPSCHEDGCHGSVCDARHRDTMRARPTCFRGRLRSAAIAANCARSAALNATQTSCTMVPVIAYPSHACESSVWVYAAVHPADPQHRDGAVLIVEAIHQLFPWLRCLFADSVYNGSDLCDALPNSATGPSSCQRAADAAGFQLLPRRWVVDRTLADLNRNRRLVKDFEASIARAKAWVYIASMQLLITSRRPHRDRSRNPNR